MSSQTTIHFDPDAQVVDTSLQELNESWRQFQQQQIDITHAEIARLIERIEHPEVRCTMSEVFSSLLNLLKDVEVIRNPAQGSSSDETKAALDRFRSAALSLVGFIRVAAMSTKDIDESLSETLDGVAFALSHDVKRSLDSELKGLDWKSGDQFVRGKVVHVRGLLTNCLQQSVITLAQVFDPTLDGGNLFDNFQARLRESLILCRDLAGMIHLVRACEKGIDRHFPRLIERITRFRTESMQFLMYKDWHQFESLTESLLDSIPEKTEPGSPLHSFLCYLETMLGQVKMRAVLADVFCDFFPDGDSTDPDWGEAQNRLAFELYRFELTSMIDRSWI